MLATHELDHHPSFRAVLEAAPPLAELAARLPDLDLVGPLVIACTNLVEGFSAPPDSRRRAREHRRAWMIVRDIDRQVSAIRRRRLAPADILAKAQRAIDRADVLIGALLPS